MSTIKAFDQLPSNTNVEVELPADHISDATIMRMIVQQFYQHLYTFNLVQGTAINESFKHH